MGTTKISRKALVLLVISRVVFFIPVMLLILFLPAGTLAYWQAWIYLAILLVPAGFVLAYLLRNDPDLLERRMRMRESQPQQKVVIALSWVYLLITFTLPGFDWRFGWSRMALPVIFAGDVIVFVGYILFFIVLRQNSYASRVVEVARGQRVISSGLYAIVRHPMYVAVMLMYLASPVALGSYWAFIPAVMIVPLLVMRIVNEEKLLVSELDGYTDYMTRTRYRLMPGIW